MRVSLRSLAVHPTLQASFVSAIAFGFYVRTLAPTVMWYDMGELAAAAHVLGIAHNTGYPLYLLIAKLFTLLPLGDVAYRVNLMSACFAALTVFVSYLTVFLLTCRRSAALVAALTIAFSSTLWANATWAASYPLNSFLTMLILFLLIKWNESGRKSWLYLACFAFGLSLGNHHLIMVVGLPIAHLVWRAQRSERDRLGWSRLLALGLLFLVGFSVNLYLPLRASQKPAVMWADASDLRTFVTLITTGMANPQAFYNPFATTNTIQFWLKILSVYPIREFTPLGLFFAASGAFWLYRHNRSLLWATAEVCLLTSVMISIYGIHNIFNYFLPIYLMAGIWIGCGVAQALEFVEERLSGVKWLRFEFLTSRRRAFLLFLLALTMPLSLLRANFRLLDRSQHRDAQDFATYLLSTVEEDSIILADWWSWTPLLYAQVVEGKGAKVYPLPALSDRGLDLEAFLDGLLEAGAKVYVARRWEDSPQEKIGSHPLQLLAPYLIHSMTTDLAPLPEFKDLLVPRGAVFEVLTGSPDLVVDGVPPEHRLEADFDADVSLLGFHSDKASLRPGEDFQFTYYWTLHADTDTDFWVDILFTDEDANVATKAGFPIWLQSHWVGGGAYPTSEWTPGDIVKESYFGLVPHGVKPGVYYVRAYLYSGGPRFEPVPASGAAGEQGVLLGTVLVAHSEAASRNWRPPVASGLSPAIPEVAACQVSAPAPTAHGAMVTTPSVVQV